MSLTNEYSPITRTSQDASYPVSLRGESANFLHDVGIQLERAGFTVGSSPSRLDHHQLLDRFYGQLELLKQDWEKTGRKTFILIDGLDHIEREQQPRQSLLSDLLDPSQIPSGVYFVLGTQTVAPLSGRIQSSLGKQGRSITYATARSSASGTKCSKPPIWAFR